MGRGVWPALSEEQLRRVVKAGKQSPPGPLARELGLAYNHVKWLQVKLGLRQHAGAWGVVTPKQSKRLAAWQRELDAVEAFIPEVSE